MKNISRISLLIISLLTFALACHQETKQAENTETKTKSINPNGDSELALLMREMAEEAESIKAQIETGETPQILVDYNEIVTASATEPHKKETDAYKAFAQVHIQSMELLEDADPSTMLTLYDNMVNNCINCHQELCPGPLVRIKKLKLPKNSLSEI